MNAIYLLYLIALPLALLAPLVFLCMLVALTSERLRDASSRVLLSGATWFVVVGILAAVPIYVMSDFRRLPVDVVVLAGGAAFTVSSLVRVALYRRQQRRLQNARHHNWPGRGR